MTARPPARRGFLARKAPILIGLVLVAGAAYWFLGRGDGAEKATYKTVKIERGTIAQTVTASGTLKATITVDVGTQISGQIKALYADFNTPVKAGQIIARIDPEAFEAKVKEAEADLAVSKANLATQTAKLESLAAEIRQAKSQMDNAKLDLERRKELLANKIVSQAQYDAAVAAFEQAEARHQGAVAREVEQRAQIEVAKAQVLQKEATLSQRRIDLNNTVIRSPVDGVVIGRNVDVGQTVAASLQSPVLFTIAQDLRQMQVEVNVDESDIGRIQEGQSATFTVDSFPGRVFPGAVRQVRKQPKEVASVITYTVVVSAENADLRLLPGMTANVTFQIERRENVMTVANAALRFRPPGARPDAPAGGANPGANPGGRGGAEPGGGGPGGQRSEAMIRELTEALSLTPEQQAKLREIFAEMGKKFRELRERGAPMETIREEMEKARRESGEKIAAVLTPEQRAKYEQMRAGRREPEAPRRATLYLLGPDGQPKAATVFVGLSDGSSTEIVRGEVKAGDAVIVGLDAKPKGGSTLRFGF
jgi:HlyD family secretion protein